MTRSAYVLQPEKCRIDGRPAWAWFPRLHLLLGWGDGLWETVGERLSGLRRAFLTIPDGVISPPVASVLDWHDRYHMFSKLRELAPPLVIEGVGARCMRYRLDDLGLCPVAADCGREPHVIVPDGEYRVRHDVIEGRVTLTLERRARRLRPMFRERIRADDRASQTAFAAFAARMRHEHVERRVKELLKDATKRPTDFDEIRLAHVRSRLGELDRRKCDARGKRKRPYAEEELLQRTCRSISRREATALLFDDAFHDEFRLDPDGFTAVGP